MGLVKEDGKSLLHKDLGRLHPEEETLSVRILQNLGLTEEEALDRIHDLSKRDLFAELVEALSKVVRRDERSIKALLAAMISVALPEPINIVLVEKSGEGKTWAITWVARIFEKILGKENVRLLVGASAKAFFYEGGRLVDENGEPLERRLAEIEAKIKKKEGELRKGGRKGKGEEGPSEEEKDRIRAELEDLKRQRLELLLSARRLVELDGKIIIFLEMPPEELLAVLRPILSHDAYEVTYHYTDKKRRTLRTTTIIIRGWPVFIFAKTEEEKFPDWLEEQIQTRFLVVSPQTGPEKYREAIRLAHDALFNPVFEEKYGLDREEELAKDLALILAELMRRRDLARRTKGEPKATTFWCPIPLSEPFPAQEGRHMRDFKRFGALVQACAGYSVFSRPLLRRGESEYAIILPKDIERALEIFADIQGTALTGLSERNLQFFEKIKEIFGDEEFRVSKAAEAFGCSYSTAEHYLKRLADIDAADREPDPNDKRAYLWRIIKRELVPPFVKETRAQIANFSKEDLERGLQEIRNFSNGDVEIFDHNRTKIDIEELWRRHFEGIVKNTPSDEADASSLRRKITTEPEIPRNDIFRGDQPKISSEIAPRDIITTTPQKMEPHPSGGSPHSFRDPLVMISSEGLREPETVKFPRKISLRENPSSTVINLGREGAGDASTQEIDTTLKCPICGLIFATQADLELHMRTHGGRRAKGPDPKLTKARHFAKLAWDLWQERQLSPKADEELRQALEELWRIIYPDREPDEGDILILHARLRSAGKEGGLEAIDRWLRQRLGEVRA